MAMRRKAMAAKPAMKEGGESKAEHKAEMSKMKGLEKELKSHESKPASKAHKGLKTGGVALGNAGGYKAGGKAKKYAKGGLAGDGIINTELEIRRLKLAIDTVINSPDARAEGFGQLKAPRLALMASQVSDAFNTKSRVNPDVVWNGSFLPSAKELDILPKK